MPHRIKITPGAAQHATVGPDALLPPLFFSLFLLCIGFGFHNATWYFLDLGL